MSHNQKIEELKKLNQQIDKTPGFAVKGLAVKAQALQVELLEDVHQRLEKIEQRLDKIEKEISRE